MKTFNFIPTASFVVGGGEVVPLMQSKFLSKKGIKITVGVLKTEHCSKYYSNFKKENPEIEFVEIEGDVKYDPKRLDLSHEYFYSLYLGLIRNTSAYLQNQNFDNAIVHYTPGVFAIPKTIPTLLILHGVPSKAELLNSVALQTADSLGAVSNSVRDGWKTLHEISKPINLLHNGIDINYFIPTNYIKEKYDISYVGRLIEIKGVQHLIRAVGILKEKGYKLYLRIGGKGPFLESLVNLRDELLLSDQITFEGYVPDEMLLKFYQESRICAFPSYDKEGVLTTMLEAAATGKAIVTCDCCGMTDFIENNVNGLLAEPKSAESLAECIKELVDNESKRKDLGQNARHSVEAGWSWESASDHLLDILRETL